MVRPKPRGVTKKNVEVMDAPLHITSYVDKLRSHLKPAEDEANICVNKYQVWTRALYAKYSALTNVGIDSLLSAKDINVVSRKQSDAEPVKKASKRFDTHKNKMNDEDKALTSVAVNTVNDAAEKRVTRAKTVPKTDELKEDSRIQGVQVKSTNVENLAMEMNEEKVEDDSVATKGRGRLKKECATKTGRKPRGRAKEIVAAPADESSLLQENMWKDQSPIEAKNSDEADSKPSRMEVIVEACEEDSFPAAAQAASLEEASKPAPPVKELKADELENFFEESHGSMAAVTISPFAGAQMVEEAMEPEYNVTVHEADEAMDEEDVRCVENIGHLDSPDAQTRRELSMTSSAMTETPERVVDPFEVPEPETVRKDVETGHSPASPLIVIDRQPSFAADDLMRPLELQVPERREPQLEDPAAGTMSSLLQESASFVLNFFSGNHEDGEPKMMDLEVKEIDMEEEIEQGKPEFDSLVNLQPANADLFLTVAKDIEEIEQKLRLIELEDSDSEKEFTVKNPLSPPSEQKAEKKEEMKIAASSAVAGNAPELGQPAQQTEELLPAGNSAPCNTPAGPSAGRAGTKDVKSSVKVLKTPARSTKTPAKPGWKLPSNSKPPISAAKSVRKDSTAARWNEPPRNLCSAMTSFVGLVKKQQQLPPTPANGKKTVKVKALDAAKAAREEEEKKAEERKQRREKVMASKQDTSEQEKKRTRAEIERKERLEKRQRMEEVAKQRKEEAMKQKLDLQEKEKRRKAAEQEEKEKRAAKEEMKKQKRVDREREMERRRKEEEESKLSKLKEKEQERKRKEELFLKRKEFEAEEKKKQEEERRVRLLENAEMMHAAKVAASPAKTRLGATGSRPGGAGARGGTPRHTPGRLVPTRGAMGPPPPRPHSEKKGNNGAASRTAGAAKARAGAPAGITVGPGGWMTAGGASRESQEVPAEAGRGSGGAQGAATERQMSGGAVRVPADCAPGCSTSAPCSPPGVVVRAPYVPAGGPQSYEISPYREESDEESEAEKHNNPKKPIPLWAKPEYLLPHLHAQKLIDPDDIFCSSKTCALEEVFEKVGNKKRKFRARTSSGNWIDDRLTWREQMDYRREMGFVDKDKLMGNKRPSHGGE